MHLKEIIPGKLSKRIVFTGPVAHNHLPQYYQRGHLLINPSLSESFGMSLIEAMACGLPVLATQVGGMTEIVRDYTNGLLVKAGDPKNLAVALDWMLKHAKEIEKMAKVARKSTVESYSWDQIFLKLDRIYQTLLFSKTGRDLA